MTLAPTWTVVPKKMQSPGPRPNPNRSPAKRVRFGKEEQGSGADGIFCKKMPEQSGLCSDVAQKGGFEPPHGFTRLLP